MVHWISKRDPAPCLQVVMANPAHAQAGYALLADRKGGAHFLLIPTTRIPGIESRVLTGPRAANYFAFAWQARNHLAEVMGHEIPRDDIGLAVNPPGARSQDQLHIHIECLQTPVVQAIAGSAGRLGESWTPLMIGGARFEARRLSGAELGSRNPFEILAEDPPDPPHGPSEYTLVLAGRQFPDGPGFVLLAGLERAGELLLDATCAAAA